jgi:propionyl-CoA carboxylase beta chain
MEERKIYGDGVVTGHGTIDGRLVFLFSQDFTVFGGSLSGAYAEKVCKIMDLAMKAGAPVIGLNDGAGRAHPGRRRQPRWLRRHLRPERPLLRRDPADLRHHGTVRGRRGVLARPSPTGSSWSKKTSYMFITGPDVIKTVTHEEVTHEELGGADTHNTRSGVAHFEGESEVETLTMVRELLSFVPSNNVDDPPFVADRRPRRPARSRAAEPRSRESRTSRTTCTA